MNKIKCILSTWGVLIFSLMLTGCEDGDAFKGTSNQRVRLCYLTFAAETYSAISRNELQHKCSDLGEIPLDAPAMVEFMNAVRQSAEIANFDDRVVRLRVQMPDGTLIFVNQDGEVISGNKIVKIPKRMIEDLDKRLGALEHRIYGR